MCTQQASHMVWRTRQRRHTLSGPTTLRKQEEKQADVDRLQLSGGAGADCIRWACCVAYAWGQGGRAAEVLQVNCVDIAKLASSS